MLSIKKVSKLLAIVISLFVLFAVIFNVFIFSNMREDLLKMNQIADELVVMQSSYSLPVRVINNVLTQYELNGAINSDNLRLAFDNNMQTLIEVYEGMENLTRELQNIQNDSVIYKLPMFEETSEALSNNLTTIQSFNQNIQTFLISDIDTQSSTVGELIELTENSMNAEVTLAHSIVTDVRHEMDDGILYTSNTILILLLGVIVLLVAINNRVRYFNEHFVIKSYELVEKKDFDFEYLREYKARFKEEQFIRDKVENIFSEQKISLDVKRVIQNTYDMCTMLQHVFKISQDHMGINRMGIAFVDYENRKIVTEGAVADYNNLEINIGYAVDFEDTSLYKILETKQGIINNDLEALYRENINSESLRRMTKEGMRSNMILPIFSGKKIIGLFFYSSSEKDFFTEDYYRLSEKILSEVSEILKRSYLVKMAFRQFASSIAYLVDNRDAETGDHLERMTKFSVTLAEAVREEQLPEYQIDNNFIEDIKSYACTHDIGKVAITDDILKKPGKLSKLEFEMMKRHTLVGREVFNKLRNTLKLFDNGYFKVAEEIVTYHHERWDGNGYPFRLSGRNIPLAARIVAIGDVLDALTSKRVYKDAYDFERAVNMIASESGKQFDPVLVDIFMKNIFEMRNVYRQCHKREILERTEELKLVKMEG